LLECWMWDVGSGMWAGHATTTYFLALASPTTPTPALPQGREKKGGYPMLKQLGFGRQQTSPLGEVAEGRRGVVYSGCKKWDVGCRAAVNLKPDIWLRHHQKPPPRPSPKGREHYFAAT